MLGFRLGRLGFGFAAFVVLFLPRRGMGARRSRKPAHPRQARQQQKNHHKNRHQKQDVYHGAIIPRRVVSCALAPSLGALVPAYREGQRDSQILNS